MIVLLLIISFTLLFIGVFFQKKWFIIKKRAMHVFFKEKNSNSFFVNKNGVYVVAIGAKNVIRNISISIEVIKESNEIKVTECNSKYSFLKRGLFFTEMYQLRNLKKGNYTISFPNGLTYESPSISFLSSKKILIQSVLIYEYYPLFKRVFSIISIVLGVNLLWLSLLLLAW